MRIYQIILKPLTGFGTPLKGDTLFGHICWQIYYDSSLLGNSLDDLLIDYARNPFFIISSVYPYIDGKIYLKRPTMPLHFLFELSEEELISRRKELKTLSHFEFNPPLPPLNEIKYEKINFEKRDEQVRCTIHRILGKTSGDAFSPFVIDKIWYLTDLVLFAGLREDISIEGIIEALRRVGHFGYGKDKTAGWGKFEVIDYKEINFYSETEKSYNAYYTLSPMVPEANFKYKKVFFEPFVRFGRHGDILSVSKNPFKAPVLMADEGAIFIPEEFQKRVYIGRAITNISSIQGTALCQGYALVIPVEVKI